MAELPICPTDIAQNRYAVVVRARRPYCTRGLEYWLVIWYLPVQLL